MYTERFRHLVVTTRALREGLDDEQGEWGRLPRAVRVGMRATNHQVGLDFHLSPDAEHRPWTVDQPEAARGNVRREDPGESRDDGLVSVRRAGVTSNSPLTSSYELPSSGRLW